MMSREASKTGAALALLLLAGAVSGQAPLSARWTLDETMGLTAADSSVNANHGTLTNYLSTAWASAVFGNGLTFNGSSNYVTCATNGGVPASLPGATYSVAAWVNAGPQSNKVIYGEGHTGNYTGVAAVFSLGSGVNSATSLRVVIRNNAGVAQLDRESIATVFDGTWHHVAWVDNGLGGAWLYIDGVLDAGDFSYTRSGFYSLNRVGLGALTQLTACCRLDGVLDEVRVYPFAITPLDVQVIQGNGTLGTGFQVNQPSARMDVNGYAGSFASAARVTIPQGTPYTLSLATSLGGFPWELASHPGVAVQNSLVLGPSNIVNVALDSATVLANNFFSTTWGVPVAIPTFSPVGYALSTSFSFTAPTVPLFLTIQFGMVDPGAAAGFSLSSAVEIDVP